MRAAAFALSHAHIKRLIEHRGPMLLLSHVTHNEVGARLTAVALPHVGVDAAHRLYVLEALGQAAAVMLRQMPQYAGRALPAFAALKQVRWRDARAPPPPLPFGALQLHVALTRARASAGTVRAVARCGGHVVCSGQLMFGFLRDE